MTFTFTQDARELFRAYWAIASRGTAYRALKAAFVLLPVVAVVRDAWMGASVVDAVGTNLVWLIALPAWAFLGIPLLYRLGTRRAFARYVGVRGTQTIEVTDEGVRIANPVGDHLVPWEQMVKARETPEFVFLYVSPRRAFHLPLRAVPADQLPVLRSLLRAHLGDRARLLGPAHVE